MTAPDWDAMVLVGRITRPHGNRGHVVVAPETDFVEARFAQGAELWCRQAGRTGAVTITASRIHNGWPIIGLTGVESITHAEAFRGCELRVPAAALPALEPGRFWHHELIGCHVVTLAGGGVGEVIRIDDGAGAPMLVVAPVGSAGSAGSTGEILVPMVDAFCRRVDIAGRRIEIEPIAGLLDVNARNALSATKGGDDRDR